MKCFQGLASRRSRLPSGPLVVPTAVVVLIWEKLGVGKAPGKYNLYLGAGLYGMRLSKLYRQAITHDEIVAELKPVLEDYAGNRAEGERFGDFCIRSGYVKSTGQGSDFHD